jgi:hypothetical protein
MLVLELRFPELIQIPTFFVRFELLKFHSRVLKQTSSTVIERVSGMSSLSRDFVDKEDIAELASTFWAISTFDLVTLRREILNIILCHPRLTFVSEDLLFELI